MNAPREVACEPSVSVVWRVPNEEVNAMFPTWFFLVMLKWVGLLDPIVFWREYARSLLAVAFIGRGGRGNVRAL